MSRRTQITLTDEQYALLKQLSSANGVTLAELIRRAVDNVYGRRRAAELDWLDDSFGAWKDRDLDGVEYVRRLRGRGLGYRILDDDSRRHEHPG